MSSEPPLVHGMRGDLVCSDWPPLQAGDVAAVMADYGLGPAVKMLWHSPRPFSAAALVAVGGREVFVKRHDRRVRSRHDLEVEHAFSTHLRDRGVTVPGVVETLEGSTVAERGESLYEVHDRMAGIDLYRDAMSWTPYRSSGHARSAGAALARMHRAASGFDRPARPAGVLVDSCAILTAHSPLDDIAVLQDERPGLASFLARRSWRSEIATALGPWLPAASAAARRQPALWTHGDWHPSNLSWTPDGRTATSRAAQVAGVFDLGLANRTFALRDLAVAIERTGISWLAAEPEAVTVDWAGIRNLVAGYRSAAEHRPHGEVDTGPVLAAILPVVHMEYALSEVEYFWSVVGSPANAELAYHDYLLGHGRWFATTKGSELLDWLTTRA